MVMLQGQNTLGQHVPYHIITITYSHTSVINISWLKDHWPYIIHCTSQHITERKTFQKKREKLSNNVLHLSQPLHNGQKKANMFTLRFLANDCDTREDRRLCCNSRQSTLERDLSLTDVCCFCHCLLRLPSVYPIINCP